MGSGSRDDHRDVTYRECANPMAKKHLRVRMAAGEILRDTAHLFLRHWAVGLVFQPVNPVSLVFVAHHTYEESEPAVVISPEDVQQRGRVERVRRKEAHENMIRRGAGIER